jgi:predicted DCC family thiol-disulfide oxidoreductase YuxK
MITVFFDGKCGLCSTEINHYRKIAPDGVFDWRDITKSANDLEKRGIRLSEGLKLLHAEDNNGRIHVGVDAFVLMWKQIRRWRILALLVSLPIIRQVAIITYGAFANWRFQRLEHCQVAMKEKK